ncbi:MAG: hypothetical protein DRI01_09850 [Chloroflexi bacterium]|nr:MAG: hypothetical protein DRI01_09850 [Chloroflexota bacterium]
MPNATIKTHTWGSLPSEGFEPAFADFVKSALPKYPEGWKSFQQAIGGAVEEFGLPVLYDVPLLELGVENSEAQIDLCIEGGGTLVHISGRQAARHEKEVLEIAAVSVCNERYRYGVLVVRADNKLKLEGNRSSYDYCSKALLQLATPVLRCTPLKGLLIVGYSTD